MGIPRIPLQYERAALAGAVVHEQLRTTTTATVRGRRTTLSPISRRRCPSGWSCARPPTPGHDDQEPETAPGEAIGMRALRALRKSRTDVEALDLTADRLRHLQNAFVEVGEEIRVRAARYTSQDDDTTAARPYPPAHRPRPHAP